MTNIYDKIAELRGHGVRGIVATIVTSQGSTPRKTGAKMLITESGDLFGTIGGGVLESTVIAKASELMKSSAPVLLSYNLGKDLGMACGGSADIFLEPFSHNYRLFIFGAGHVGKALANLARNLDFNTVVVDEREEVFSSWEYNEIDIYCGSYESFINSNQADEKSFIVILTPSHSIDFEVLKNYAGKPFAYCGVIGSKRKALEMKNRLISEKYCTAEDFEQIDIPVGIDIEAEGPEEIAISIAAKLILEKSKLIKNTDI